MKKIFKLLICVLIVSCSSDDGGNSPIVGGPSNPNPNPSTPDYLQDQVNFPIGNTVSAAELASSSATNTAFKEVLLNDYNSITAGNDMKMYNMYMGPNSYDWSDGDAIVAYAKDNDLRVHGHTLLWHPEYAIPNWLENFSGTDAEFETLIKDYIQAAVAHFADALDDDGNPIVQSWDVVNEGYDGGALRSTLFQQRIGDDYIAKAFQWAREADPDVKLFYNDYNIAGTPAKRAAILNMVSEFQNNGTPIDGIGMQMHLNHDWPTSDLPLAIQEIANTGLLVHVSELDVKVNYADDLTELTAERAALQSDQYQRVSYYYKTIVPTNQQFGITVWGVRDVDSWLYDNGTEWPLMYDADFEPKPAYDGFKDGLNGTNVP
ncbi:endo-1,4-beta-xylanase [Mangrovimonas xylaniphaga]|uniref:endo-1,4-beta-xylanase n=1 Tax=Mangrovimonas xylaniphaga TaxID=1645915 RepID=UPI0006B63C6B|nr:endo-1,4-beta-xylanase [Mangrovimonas xylaniphaga]